MAYHNEMTCTDRPMTLHSICFPCLRRYFPHGALLLSHRQIHAIHVFSFYIVLLSVVTCFFYNIMNNLIEIFPLYEKCYDTKSIDQFL